MLLLNCRYDFEIYKGIFDFFWGCCLDCGFFGCGGVERFGEIGLGERRGDGELGVDYLFGIWKSFRY